MGIETALVGGLLGAGIAANGQKSAAKTAAGATREANALQKYIFDTQREDQAPWRAAGQSALQNLMGLLDSGQITSKFAGNVLDEPGYQFTRDEGMRAIDNSASARGGIGGAALKAGTRFAQDNANRFYNDAFNRFQTERTNTLNPLFQMAGFGTLANQQAATAGQNYANQVGGNLMDLANVQGASAIGRGNIYGNLLNQGVAYGNRNNWWQAPSPNWGTDPNGVPTWNWDSLGP